MREILIVHQTHIAQTYLESYQSPKRILNLEMNAKRKLIHELKNTFHRWEEESDLFDDSIIDACKKALREYYDEQVIEFESDIELIDDGEDDE